MQSINTDVDSIGGGFGGGFGGLGGGSGGPLMWLITLAFLRGKGGILGGGEEGGHDGGGHGMGVLAGQTQSKLDCLAQNQATMQNQIQSQTEAGRFSQLENGISTIAATNRGIQDSIFRESSATQTALAECCCNIRREVAEVNTSIALQTNAINTVAAANTQKVLDKLCDNSIVALQTDNANLRGQLNKAEIIAELGHTHRRSGLAVN